MLHEVIESPNGVFADHNYILFLRAGTFSDQLTAADRDFALTRDPAANAHDIIQ